MIRYAVQGEPHDRIPDELAAFTLSRRQVVPWLCPECDGTVAETVVDYVALELSVVRTVLPFEAVRVADAERDGVPFYGPTKRELSGKSARHSLKRRRDVARTRAIREGGWVQADLDVLPKDVVDR